MYFGTSSFGTIRKLSLTLGLFEIFPGTSIVTAKCFSWMIHFQKDKLQLLTLKKFFFEELVKIYDCLKSKFSHNSPENGSSWCPKSKLENGHEARDS
jgi:hypothetical protein